MPTSQGLPKFQTTLMSDIHLNGIGVHSGRAVKMVLKPADPHHGILFKRIDLAQSKPIKAHYSNISDTSLCTVLGDPKGAHISTVEHLLAALSAMHIDNVMIEIDGPEIPIMDGSSITFIDAIMSVGTVVQAARRKYIQITDVIEIKSDDMYASFTPYEKIGFKTEIDFASPCIGRQSLRLDLSDKIFKTELARARTFGFMKDVKWLRESNLALGASLENTLVLDEGAILNPEGARWQNECVRHKMLDAIGDLTLAGAPILGLYASYKGGHTLNALSVKALYDNPQSWEWTESMLEIEKSSSVVKTLNDKIALKPDHT